MNFSNYSTVVKSKYYDNSNKLVVGKIKDDIVGVAIEELFGLKSKMCPYLVDDNSEHKKAKGINKNVTATTNQNEHKDVSLNKKWLH